MFRLTRFLFLFAFLFVPLTLGCAPWDSTSQDSPTNAEDAVLAAGNPVVPNTHSSAQTAALSAEAIPGFKAIAAGTPGTIDVMVKLRGADAPNAKRPPLDLALVIDRSGSMAGDKLAAVKEAALDVVNRLEPVDRVTLISYETGVDVHAVRLLVDAQGRTRLRRHILGLQDEGSTALGPALFRALDTLGGARRSEDVLAHVMLLSDGLANEGEQRPDVIAARAAQAFRTGVATSTLGVGLDYNEDLMTRVADEGGGRYHFIEDSTAIPTVVADEFAGLVSTVARNVELQIAPGSGLEVVRVFGYPTTEDNGVITARVGALAANQTRQIIVRLRHPAVAISPMPLGMFTVDFRDALDGGRPDKIVLRPTVEVTSDLEKVRASEQTSVTVRVAELEAADQLRIATTAVEEGRYEDAKQVLDGSIGRLREQAKETPSAELDAQIGEMEEAHRDVDKAKTSVKHRKHYEKKQKSRGYLKGKK